MGKAGRPKGIPKTGGRKKGSPNRTTEEMRNYLQEIINKQMNHYESDLEKIRANDPEKAIALSAKLMEYIIPKMSSVKVEADIKARLENINININNGSKHSDNENL